MKIRTKDATKLKRLAKNYADATANFAFLGAEDPEDHDDIRKRHKKAREKLHQAIDELCSDNLTPRAVEDM